MGGNMLINSSLAFLLLVASLMMMIQVEATPLKHGPPPPPGHGYEEHGSPPPPGSQQKPRHAPPPPRHGGGGPGTGGNNPTMGGKMGIAAFSLPPYTPSACLNDVAPTSTMITAVEPSIYRHGKACGRHYQVTCTGAVDKRHPNPCKKGGKPVVVTVTDSTSPKKEGPPGGYSSSIHPTFVLSKKAFAAIANPHAGLITISFKPVNKGKNKPY